MNKATADLEFNLSFKSTDFSQIEIPVEVRKTDLELVAKPLTSGTVSVEPGTYYVSAELPSGQVISQLIEAKRGKNMVQLSPSASNESPFETHERTHFLRTDFNELGKINVNRFDPTRKGIGRILRGNPLLQPEQPGPPTCSAQPMIAESSIWWQIPIPSSGVEPNTPGDQFLLFQFVRPGAPALNFALPRSQVHGCTVIVVTTASGDYNVSVQVENVEADLLVRYQEESYFSQLQTLGKSDQIAPEKLLQNKTEDPIAASIGAYNILRLGELERLHDWTANLQNFFPWLPDGAAICGEHFARIGNAEDALNSFLLLDTRGLPYFSYGLSFALDRLRLFTTSWDSYFGTVEGELFNKTQNLLRKIEGFEPFVNFDKAVLTFVGTDPFHPDDKAINEIPTEGFAFEF